MGGWVGAVEDGEGSAAKDRSISSQPLMNAERCLPGGRSAGSLPAGFAVKRPAGSRHYTDAITKHPCKHSAAICFLAYRVHRSPPGGIDMRHVVAILATAALMTACASSRSST